MYPSLFQVSSPGVIPHCFCQLLLDLFHLLLFQTSVLDTSGQRLCRSLHNTHQCFINICPLQNQNPSYIKTCKKESHGTNSFTETGEKRPGCSAISFVGRLDCIQHGISKLLVIQQAIARDFGSVCVSL